MKLDFDITNNRLIATLNPESELKVAYLQPEGRVVVLRKTHLLKSFDVAPGYPIDEFLDFCLRVKCGDLDQYPLPIIRIPLPRPRQTNEP